MAYHKVASFKHDINAQLRCISPIWTLSHSAHDVGGIWMSPTLGVLGAISGEGRHEELVLQGDTPNLQRGEESFVDISSIQEGRY